MASGPAAMNKIDRAHQMYRDGKYAEALDCYTDAFPIARTNTQKIALHSNRAACYLRLHDFKKAAEECAAVLELDRNHTGALMLRAQTLVTLKDYNAALFDVNQLIELNPTSEVYRNLQARLKTQLSLATIPEDDEMPEEDNDSIGETKLVEEEETSPLDGPNAEVTAASQDPTTCTTSNAKGKCYLDYSRWEKVEDDSSEEDEESDDKDEEDDDCQPQYRFRVKSVGVRAIE